MIVFILFQAIQGKPQPIIDNFLDRHYSQKKGWVSKEAEADYVSRHLFCYYCLNYNLLLLHCFILIN